MAATKTFLQLCKDVRQECGIHGTGPASVTSATGVEKRLVDWVREAWRQIQRKRQDWLFMRDDFSFETTAETAAYAITATTGLSDIDTELVSCYLTSAGVAGEYCLSLIDYDYYRRCYGIGSHASGTPIAYAISPDLKLVLAPTPDDAYTVRGMGRKVPQDLRANTDIVALDDEYIDVVKWLAVQLYAGFEEAGNVFAHADAMYRQALRTLEREQLPAFRNYVEPLA